MCHCLRIARQRMDYPFRSRKFKILDRTPPDVETPPRVTARNNPREGSKPVFRWQKGSERQRPATG